MRNRSPLAFDVIILVVLPTSNIWKFSAIPMLAEGDACCEREREEGEGERGCSVQRDYP